MSWSINRASRILLNIQRHHSSQATFITPEARRKWGLSGLPSPQSILDDDDTPLPPSLSLAESPSSISEQQEQDISDSRRSPLTPPLHLRKPPASPTPTEWATHRQTIKKSFPGGWSPPKKLSRSAMDGLRELHHMDPEKFTTPVLAERFRVSPEAVRRILKSKWEPTEERRSKWVEKERTEREERDNKKKLLFETEREETKNILEWRKFRGGLELTEAERPRSRVKRR